jgi:hypothetical protein
MTTDRSPVRWPGSNPYKPCLESDGIHTGAPAGVRHDPVDAKPPWLFELHQELS